MSKIWSIAVCLLLCVCSLSFGAGPLFHVVIAEKWMDAFEDYTEEERRSFILGTLFPDIRHLAGLPRESTHRYGWSVEELRAIEDPFFKGMMVHSFVDENRDAYVQKHRVKDLLRNMTGGKEDMEVYLKMVEEEILYSWRDTSDNDYLFDYLGSIANEELAFNAPVSAVQEWHNHLIGYFSSSPKEGFTMLLSKNKSFAKIPLIMMEGCLQAMENFGEDENLKDYVSIVIGEFDRLFSSSKQSDKGYISKHKEPHY